MAFLDSIEQLRAIEWGSSHLWDVKFPTIGRYKGAPSPFDEWFPATEVKENRATLQSFDFQGILSTYKVPQISTLFDIELVFLDDVDETLIDWIEEWINVEILHNGRYIATIAEAVKPLMIAKLDRQREVIKTDLYLVYPEIALYFQGDSQAGNHQYSVPFIVAGKYEGNMEDLL